MSIDFNAPETQKELKKVLKDIKRTFDSLYQFQSSEKKKKIRRLATS